MKTSRLVLCAIVLATLVSCVKNNDNEKIAFETLTAAKSEACPFNAAEQCFNVSYRIELPENDDAVSEVIRRTLVTDMFDEKFVRQSNANLLDAYIAEMKDEYEHNSVDGEDLSFSNYSIDSLEAARIFVGDKLLSYEATRYVYSGGAHGMQVTSCWVFDLETGNQLTEDDIFVDNYAANLTDLIKQVLIEEAIKNNIPLDSYWMNQIEPNGNFVITEEGMFYQFNPYDIAPYCVGSTRLLLPKSTLLPLLKEGTAVRELFAE